MKKHFILFLKGMAMGIANVIPGVSGGTIALITEIYEELINSLKSFDLKSLKLLFSLKIKEFINKADIVTYEFENIPIEILKSINKERKVLPKPDINQTVQNRKLEKTFVNKTPLSPFLLETYSPW